MHRPFKELSRGYKQRVGLAHALLGDPEILVLDEPTSGLDPNQIVEIRSLIKKVGKQKTVIFSTHILSEAEATCERILIINKGKIVADGAPDTLRASLTGRQVVRMGLRSAEFEDVAYRISLIPGVDEVTRQPSVVEDNSDDDALYVRVVCQGDIREDLYRKVKEKDWVLVEFAKERQSLEETFRQLTMSDRTKGED